MSVLVDTSVWIDFLRGKATPATETLRRLEAERVAFGITAMIYQEVLQGADSMASFERLDAVFRTQRFFHPTDPVTSHRQAAALYVRCRRSGVTIRSTVDCLIVQIALEHGLALLQSDRDFPQIARLVPELVLL